MLISELQIKKKQTTPVLPKEFSALRSHAREVWIYIALQELTDATKNMTGCSNSNIYDGYNR